MGFYMYRKSSMRAVFEANDRIMSWLAKPMIDEVKRAARMTDVRHHQ